MIMILKQDGEIIKHWSFWDYIQGQIEKFCKDAGLEIKKQETDDSGDLLVWVDAAQ